MYPLETKPSLGLVYEASAPCIPKQIVSVVYINLDKIILLVIRHDQSYSVDVITMNLAGTLCKSLCYY